MRLRTTIAALALLVVALIAPVPAAAILPPSDGGTINFPGRMLRDDYDTWQNGANGRQANFCRGTAYGKVDGDLVLFVANHCDAGAIEGQPAYTNGWVIIGTWGKRLQGWANNDLAYIRLYPSWRPTSGLNKVYRGSIANESNFWTITSQPGVYDGCAGFPAGGEYPDTSYLNYQATFTTSYDYEVGHVTGLFNHDDGCGVFTDFDSHLICCESGAPVIRYSDTTTINGLMTGYNNAIPSADEGVKFSGGLYFNPIYEGLEDLKGYFGANDTGLCITSTCGL